MWSRLLVALAFIMVIAGCSAIQLQFDRDAQGEARIGEALKAWAAGDYAGTGSALKDVLGTTRSELTRGEAFFWECLLDLDRKNPEGDLKKGIDGLRGFSRKYPGHPRNHEARVIERVAGRVTAIEEDNRRTSRQLHLMEQENKRLLAELEGLKALHLKMEQMEKNLKGRQ